MKCDEYQSLIEEYIDGELDGTRADRVGAHIAACKSCSVFSEEIRKEQEIYAHYERGIEVTPALWAAIEERISLEPHARLEPSARPHAFTNRLREWFINLASTPKFSPALAAALVIITVGVTVALMSYINSTQPGAGNNQIANRNDNGSTKEKTAQANANESTGPAENGGTQSGEQQAATGSGQDKPGGNNSPEAGRIASNTARSKLPRPAPKEPTPEELIRDAEQKYVAAIAILSRDVNSRRSKIDPKVLARFDTALADIDYTIAETQATVRQHPNDPVALQYMLSAYAKKVDVLREMAREQ